MIQLAIDTAQDACSVALLNGTDILAEQHILLARGHAEQLVPMVAALLAAHQNVKIEQIAVDIGPGSFTGLRVGLAAARAFALAWNVPVVGYHALRLAAAQAFAGDGHPQKIWVMLHAGRGQLYITHAHRDGRMGAVENMSPAEAVQRVQAGDVLVGNGVALIRDALRADAVVLHEGVAPASAVRFLRAEDFTTELQPLYVRAQTMAGA